MKTIKAYKLFRVRADGTLGSLFVDATARIPYNVWIKSKAIRKEGFFFRPGWHACSRPYAPHLSMRGRQWRRVELRGVKIHPRPHGQGGTWYTAEYMRVLDR